MPLLGNDLVINVETAVADTFVEVKDGRAWNGTVTTQNSTVAVFNRAARYTATSTDEETYTLAWLYTTDDDGQDRVREVARAKTPELFQFLVDGTNGWEIEALVTERGIGADPDGNFMEFTATLSGNDVPTVVGTGVGLL